MGRMKKLSNFAVKGSKVLFTRLKKDKKLQKRLKDIIKKHIDDALEK
jgi:hypothetical protein